MKTNRRLYNYVSINDSHYEGTDDVNEAMTTDDKVAVLILAFSPLYRSLLLQKDDGHVLASEEHRNVACTLFNSILNEHIKDEDILILIKSTVLLRYPQPMHASQ